MTSSLVYPGVVLLVTCVGLSQQTDVIRHVVDTLFVDNGNQNKGSWKISEYCPHLTYATGFDLYVEPDQGLFGDDTAMNGLRMTCQPRAATPSKYHGVIEAYQGEWGTWRGQFDCAADLFITQFRQRVEKPSLFDDDTGTNNMDFFCRHFDFDSEGQILEGNGESWGKWGEWSNSCPLNSGVCGFQTQYQGPAVDGNSAMNDIRLFCCDD